MDANPRTAESGYKRIGRLLLVVASFAGTFFIVSKTMILFGTAPVEANAGGLICGLAIMAYVMFLPPQS
jgi:hypothetical protein